jgi:2-methylcitrate dehydratase PrpD
VHQTQQLAQFALRATYDQLSESARASLKLHVLDSLACALGAEHADPALRSELAECVANLDSLTSVRDLTKLLAAARPNAS